MVHIKKSFSKKTTKIPCYLLWPSGLTLPCALSPLMSSPTRPRTHRSSFKPGSLIPFLFWPHLAPLHSWDTFTCPPEPGQSGSQSSCSVMSDSATPWPAARRASLSITNSWSLLRLMSIESVMTSNPLILCRPLLLPPSIFSRIRVFSNESALRIRWRKCWSFSFNISPSNEHPGLISFGMDRLDLLAGQGTLKSLLQHHSSKASVFWHSAFFIVQFSHPYMTTGKTMTLTGWIFVGKVMSLLFNMLSRLVMGFLPRSKHLLISRL